MFAFEVKIQTETQVKQKEAFILAETKSTLERINKIQNWDMPGRLIDSEIETEGTAQRIHMRVIRERHKTPVWKPVSATKKKKKDP